MLGRVLFSSVVMVSAFSPGVIGSNPARTLYFCHAFVHLFLCHGLSLKEMDHKDAPNPSLPELV